MLNIHKKESFWKRSSEYTSLFSHELNPCLVTVYIPVTYNECLLNFTYSMFNIYYLQSLQKHKYLE